MSVAREVWKACSGKPDGWVLDIANFGARVLDSTKRLALGRGAWHQGQIFGLICLGVFGIQGHALARRSQACHLDKLFLVYSVVACKKVCCMSDYGSYFGNKQ